MKTLFLNREIYIEKFSMYTIFDLMKEVLTTNNEPKYEQLDFTKEEDLEKLKNSVEKIKNVSFFSEFIDTDLLDNLVDKAQAIYDNAHKKQEVPTRPSLKVSDKIASNVRKLADEYVDTLIKPYMKSMTDKQEQEIKDSLTEFACWMYSK